MIAENIDSSDDLTSAVREALERRGVLSSLKAKLRTEVFHALEDKSVSMPEKPHDVLIATELIRDLLMCFRFDNTNSVFCEESGQPAEMNVDRSFLSNELGFNLTAKEQNNSARIPVLVLLIQQLRRMKSQHEIDLMSTRVDTAPSL